MTQIKPAYVIVVGNEKGGSGKTTSAMHIIVGLLQMGFIVGTIDLDAHQRTLTRYVYNRRRWNRVHGPILPLPHHSDFRPSSDDSVEEARREDAERLAQVIAELKESCDYIVIDCPGAHSALAAEGHSYAETLITPINDSLVDLDLLVQLNPGNLEVDSIGSYARMVIQQRRRRVDGERPKLNWLVMRNRLSSIANQNKMKVTDVLARLSAAMGFRLIEGFGERVIFRQLFLEGATVLDLREPVFDIKLTMSHVAARQEIRKLLESLDLEPLNEKLPMIGAAASAKRKKAKEPAEAPAAEQPETGTPPSVTAAQAPAS